MSFRSLRGVSCQAIFKKTCLRHLCPAPANITHLSNKICHASVNCACFSCGGKPALRPAAAKLALSLPPLSHYPQNPVFASFSLTRPSPTRLKAARAVRKILETGRFTPHCSHGPIPPAHPQIRMGKAYQSLSASWQFLAALVVFLLAHGNCDARAPTQDLGGETDALNLVNHRALVSDWFGETHV